MNSRARRGMGPAAVGPRRRVHVAAGVGHERWRGPLDISATAWTEPPRHRRVARLQPVLLDDVAHRLVVSGLPDRVAAALLLAVLPSHFAEVGGRRLVARTAHALGKRSRTSDGA